MISFEEIGIEENILRAIKELGFEEPMPIQEKVIPHLMQEDCSDLIALAQTGTGKTAAFGLPLIQKTKTTSKKIQHLILCPTRELCLQIADDLSSFAKYKSDVKIVPVFGGASIERQIQKIRSGVHIVSATPGRLIDLIDRNIIDLSKIKTVVLDEADEMLNMGFRDDLETILASTPKEKNTFLFSATMPNEIKAIANKYMNDPVEITVGKRNAGAENIEHVCYVVQSKDRYPTLKRIVDFHPDIYGIVFCRTRRETQEVADSLLKDGYNADALHGDLSQQQRDFVMNKFRIKNLQLLVATDVAARGLDVENLTHIINYNIPEELELYTHRSGRTGRAGRKGTSVAIITPREKGKIHQIEKQLNKKFTFASIPKGKVICERQLLHLIDKMEKVEVDSSQIDPLLPDILRKLEWLEKDELIKKFVSVEFNRFVDYYKNLPDINSPEEGRGSKSHGSSSGLSRFFINLGKTDELGPKTLMDLISDLTGKNNIEIGDIEILRNFSFFEADSNYSDLLVNSINGKLFKKRKINIEVAQPKSKERRERSRDNKPFRERNKFKSDFKSKDKFSRSGSFRRKR